MHRLRSLVVAAATTALLAPASGLGAQTTSATTQQVPFTVRVPFTLQRIYPAVTEIQFSCMLYVDGSGTPVGVVQSPKVGVAQLPKAADGSISGEATASGTVTVPTTTAGKGGNYRCLPYGCANTFCRQLAEYASGAPEYMLASNSSKIATGTFTW